MSAGVSVWPNSDYILASLVFVHEDRSIERYSSVNEKVLRKACKKVDVPYNEVLSVLLEQDESVHTVYIDVPVFKAHIANELRKKTLENRLAYALSELDRLGSSAKSILAHVDTLEKILMSELREEDR